MRHYIAIIGFLLFSFSLPAQKEKTLHDFKVKTINGELFDMSRLKGKKVLIVNTASKCGLTPQYKELEELYKHYRETGFIIIGFPANDFMKQEPGSNEEIMEFCRKNYGVSFPMMAKISVKGDKIAPIYRWLTTKDKNGVMDTKIKWNFQKYMINEEGHFVDVVYPKESPKSEKIIKWIESKQDAGK